MVVVPTNVDCTRLGLLGLVIPHGMDISASLIASNDLVTQCGMLIEASGLGLT